MRIEGGKRKTSVLERFTRVLPPDTSRRGCCGSLFEQRDV